MTIQRHFLGWDRPALPVAAQFLIDKYATGKSLDLSQVVLVFSGHQAARRMLELLVELAESRWPALIPPAMTTFDPFPERLYREQRRLADDLTQLLVWRRALLAVGQKAVRPAIPELPPEDSLAAWIALCNSLRCQHDELAAEGLDFENVVDALAESGIRTESERWQALRQVQAEYLMQMDGLDLWDRQTARLIAVEKNECTTDRDIVLIGTVDMHSIVCRMLDQVADRVTALIHAPQSEEDAFDRYGCLIPNKWQERRIDIPDDVTIVADNPVDQADRLVQQLANDSTLRRADDIAIAIADNSLVPPVVQALTNAGVAGRWPVGSEIRASRPWRLLQALADHLGTAQKGQPPDFDSLANLVRHPDVGRFIEGRLSGLGHDAVNWLTQLDLYRSHHLQPVPGEILRSNDTNPHVIQGICTAVEHLLQQLLPPEERREISTTGRRKRRQVAASAQQSLPFDGDSPRQNLPTHSQMERRRPLNEWATGALQLLAVIYHDYETDRHPQRDASIEACLEALTETNDALAAIPVDVMPRCTAAQALPVILSQIAGRTIPSADDEAAIDLMGWLEIPMDDSPVVVIAGFNEGRIPESASSDVFLPNSVRSQLGLKDNERRYARDAWALQTLLNNREQLTLIAGRHDSDGDPLAPSRLWFAGHDDEIPRRVLQFYKSAIESADVTAESPETPQREFRISEFTVPAPPAGRTPPVEIAVTAFRRFLESPYRYLLERELRLKTIEDHPRELDALAFGNVVHDVLNDFGTSDARYATDSTLVERNLLDLLDRRISRRFGKTLSATVAVQLQMIRERLRGFAVWQANQTADGWIIRDTEKTLAFPHFRDSQGRFITINGRIDRIDQHEKTGQWRVFDYKSSETDQTPMKVHRAKDGEWKDLQLPLYRLLARTAGVDGDVSLGYVNLPGDVSKLGEQIADWSDDDLESAFETARHVAACILDLRINSLTREDPERSDVYRICQDTVVNPQIPWLEKGRRMKAEG